MTNWVFWVEAAFTGKEEVALGIPKSTLNRLGSIGCCSLALAALLFLALRSNAQVLYGSLTGNVIDSTDRSVPNAKVEALNVATGVARQAVTDDRGGYLISDLQQGVYRVTITATSFATVVENSVTVDANTVRRVDTRLQVAQVSQSVTVDASAAALQTDRSDVSAEMRPAQLTELPTNSNAIRNFQSVFLLIPGVSPPASEHSEAGNPQAALGTNVNGASYNNNNTRIDGVSDLYPWLPEIVAYVPAVEAIQTVNVVTASFDAEQGMAGGSVVNVTIKPGTNQYHGTAWEFNTISALKARNYFYYGASNPKNIINQFGGNFGGPIKKNKLFFFADWEETDKRANVSALETVAQDPLRQGNFSATGTTIYDPNTGAANGVGRTPFPNNAIPAARFASASQKMIALMPEPNQPSASATPTNDYFGSADYASTHHNIDTKVNWNPNEKSAVFVRYGISPSRIFDPPGLGPAEGNTLDGGQPGTATGRVQSTGVGSTYSISPTLVADGSFGYTRLRLDAENVDIGTNYGLTVLNIPGANGSYSLDGGYPNFGVSGFSSFGNSNVSNPFLFRDNEYNAALNLSWVKTSHSIRFGAEFQHFAINHFQPQTSFGPRGGFTFTGGITSLNGGPASNLYNAWGDFLLGLPQQLGTSTEYINPATVRETTYAFYARDQWQVSRQLTISYGIRYELYPFATRDHYGADIYNPVTGIVCLGGVNGNPHDCGVNAGNGQVAPRIGIAYRINDKTVFRAGYGMSIDPNSYRAMRDAYPATIAESVSGPTSYQASGSLVTGIPPIVGPTLSQGSFPLPTNITTTTYPANYRRGYIESVNVTLQHDFGFFTLQAAYVSSLAIRHTDDININAAGPGGGVAGQAYYPITGQTTAITESTPFNNAKYNALQTQLTRRLGAAGVFGITYTFSKSMDYGDNDDSGLTWAWIPMYLRNYALAGFDRTHNFQAYWNYALPFGRGKSMANHGVAAALAGGWQLNGILSRFSGAPFTVGSSGSSVNAPGNTQTAGQILPSVDILGGHGIGANGASYFNPVAFAPVTTVSFGNSGRDILRGPGVFNMNASLFRDFRVKERFHLQFRAEAFNVTNTPQFGNPGATVSSATFNGDGSVKSLNGYTQITSAGNERQLRFALRFSF
ncbi:Cna B domain protein [Candidatus Sulfopaludibacter sp. SbA4]|nr:Cna B domain protein [Candidatus Sulfopaludibacter sp. SbA4]